MKTEPSPLTPLGLRALACLLLFAAELALLYSSPDIVQKQSCTLQRGLQNLFSPGLVNTAATMSRNTSEGFIPQGTTTAVLLSNFLSSLSERSSTLFNSLISTLGLGNLESIHEKLPWGMYWAATLYRATSWRTWLAASAMLAWAYDHDMGVNLFTFMTISQVAQSLARNIIGSPPGYWLCATGPQQLCHSEGYSLPPENLTLALTFFFFLNYQLKQVYDTQGNDETTGMTSSRRIRASIIKILGIVVPVTIAVSTTYYGTHSLLDNLMGITFSLLLFSLYRLWDEAYLHASANNIWGEGEEDGSKNPDLRIQLIEKEVERRIIEGDLPAQAPVSEEGGPRHFFHLAHPLELVTPRTLFHLLGGVSLIGSVYMLEGLIRVWDAQALSQYPDSWKQNLERNCNLHPGAAPFLMSLHSLGFGFAHYANACALAGVLVALGVRDYLKLADSTSKHRPLDALLRLILGSFVSGAISKVLRLWLLEESIGLGTNERTESVIMHLELFLRPMWVIALSPVVFDLLNLGNFLDDFEKSEDLIILQEAEEKAYRTKEEIMSSSSSRSSTSTPSKGPSFPGVAAQSSGASIRQRPSTRGGNRVIIEETTIITPEAFYRTQTQTRT